MSLARELLKLKTTEQVRAGTATVIDVAPFTIDLGDGVPIPDPPRDASYTPAVDDVVLVLRLDATVIVAFKIA